MRVVHCLVIRQGILEPGVNLSLLYALISSFLLVLKRQLVFVQLCPAYFYGVCCLQIYEKSTCLYHALCTDFRKISIVIGNTKIKRTVLSQLRQVNRCSPRLFCNTTIDPLNLLLVSLLPH